MVFHFIYIGFEQSLYSIHQRNEFDILKEQLIKIQFLSIIVEAFMVERERDYIYRNAMLDFKFFGKTTNVIYKQGEAQRDYTRNQTQSTPEAN